MAAKGAPKWSKGCPRDPKRAQSRSMGEKDVEGHPKGNKKSHNYIHINKIYANYRSTAIKRPASNIMG